jgi:hypothetical protein
VSFPNHILNHITVAECRMHGPNSLLKKKTNKFCVHRRRTMGKSVTLCQREFKFWRLVLGRYVNIE